MSAADHINETQKLRVFHMSWEESPPHLQMPDVRYLGAYRDAEDNVHPYILHAGTRRAALVKHRTHLHEYEIDPDVVDPVVYGDAPYMIRQMNDEQLSQQWKNIEFRAAMQGKQEGLWESIPGNPEIAISRNVVLPYRNYAEDIGSISYMIPKSLIEQNKVRHVGVTDVSVGGIRRQLENEENLYTPLPTLRH